VKLGEEQAVTELKTDPALLNALQKALRHIKTASEAHEQRISFIIGNLSKRPDVTRADVERVLAEQEGN
jgi:hypothetical protein